MKWVVSRNPVLPAAVLFAALALSACAVRPQFAAGVACATGRVTVSDDFAGARRGSCTVRSATRVELEIRPENSPPINDSPWYAFRLKSDKPTTLRVTMKYVDGHHRYWPKLSFDGKEWSPLAADKVRTNRAGTAAHLTIRLDEQPVFIAAQELILPTAFDEWRNEQVRLGHVSQSILGHSVNGRPIHRLDTGSAHKDVLLIVGRQHPPEVSGSVAFQAFAATLFDDSDLAARFRDRFRVIGVPFLNPDGVIDGHWRHNLGGVDLNRDWGPFTQPETRLIEDLLAELDAADASIRVFLDFHSTQRNVFYTQNDDFVTDPPGFTPQWLANAAARVQNYEFVNQPGPVGEQANSKNYMYKRYGIPTATFEIGDETDREATRDAARIFAEELMKLMLQQDYGK